MENFLTNYRNYIEFRKGAKESFESGCKEINSNYAGKLRDSKLEELKTAYDETIRGCKGDCVCNVEKAFKDARERLIKSASKPIPAELRDSLSAFEGLKVSDSEKEMILEMTKNSYLARKRAVELLGIDSDQLPPSLDDVLSSIDSLETVVKRSFDKPIDSYDARLVVNGDWVTQVQNEINSFCEAYGTENN